MSKPTIFIGSSEEALKYANSVRAKLQDVGSVTVWNDKKIWKSGRSTLENLINLPPFDYAVLILTSDDRTTSRGRRTWTPRDNVIFELGLFMGRLGRFRTLFLLGPNVKVPSDLKGIMYVPLERKRSASEAVSRACRIIRGEVRSQGFFRLFESPAIIQRIKMSSWKEIYLRAAKLVVRAESTIRATSLGMPPDLKDEKAEYFKRIAMRAAEQEKHNVQFVYRAVCSTKKENPNRDHELLERRKIFKRYRVLDCLEVREITGFGRVDFLIVDDKDIHVSFRHGHHHQSKLAFGLELADAEELVRPIASWYDQYLFPEAKPINWDKVH